MKDFSGKMKLFSAILPLICLALLGSGCFFGQNDFVPPSDYDLAPSGNAAAMAVPVEFGTFRNISGTDRRMAVRRSGSRVEHDEYNRWLLPPEVMMRRLLAGNMPQNNSADAAADAVRVDCVLRRFDFDAAARKAQIAADFRIRYGNRIVRKSIAKSSPWQSDSAEARAAAMNDAAQAVAVEVRNIIAGLPEKGKNK